MKLASLDEFAGARPGQSAVYRLQSGREHRIYFIAEPGVALPKFADHWFLLGATMAFVLGEDYRQDQPVCPSLLANFRRVVRQWCAWFPEKSAIDLKVGVRDPNVEQAPGKAHATFFSGGVDSLFTTAERGSELSALISIAHTRTEGEVSEAFARQRELTPYAVATGRRHILVATNLMTEVPEFYDAWHHIGHGAALASVAHFLSSNVGLAVISSTQMEDSAAPLGSHPEIDPLFSSRGLGIEHFGADHSREAKTGRVARDPEALKILSVCGAGRLGGRHVNCSKCEKCLRTMITLDLYGVKPKDSPTFDWSSYSPERYGDLFLRKDTEYIFAREIADLARSIGRRDVVVAVDRAIARSKPFSWLVKAEMAVRLRAPWIVRHKRSLLTFRSATYGLLGLRR